MAVRLWVRRAGSQGAAGDEGEGAHYEFEQPRLVIGRSPSADLRLPDLTVSDLHATLEQTERGYGLRDMRSTNGTRVNDTPLVPDRTRALHDGDRLEVGAFEITFQTGGPVTGLTSPERTVSLARRLLREGRAEASVEPASLAWSWAGTGREDLPLPSPPARWLLGSAADADLQAPDDAPEAMAELDVSLDGVRVRALCDLPLAVNGKPTRERLLRDGDRVQCGDAELRLQDPTDRALRALEGQADAPIERTAQGPAPTREPDARSGPVAGEPTPPPTDTPAPSPAPPAPRPSLGPDAVVYALALIVLAASAVGMVWLLGG